MSTLKRSGRISLDLDEALTPHMSINEKSVCWHPVEGGMTCDKGPFTNDVRREGEGGGCPNSDAVREVA